MRKNIAVIGGQFGDEGKGKIVDYLVYAMSPYRILNYRWQGGKNAGHIVVRNGVKYALHQIPSGILADNVYAFLGKGMFLHPRALLKEIDNLKQKGLIVGKHNLGISSQAHVTLDYHTAEDEGCFNIAEHSSTGSGIKQTARDKANRIGIRFVEFLDKKLMQQILEERIVDELKIRGNNLGKGFVKKLSESYEYEREILSPLIRQENDVFNSNEFIYGLGEGAQGVGLDLDSGLYPGITSSNPCQPTHRPNKTLGVFKAYNSSVGIKDRPFMTEMDDILQEKLVDEWMEKGTTTGKTRHIGWFDAVFAKYAIESGDMDEISLTCLDRLETLGNMGEKIKVAIAYKINGKRYDNWDILFDRRDTLWNAKPIYREFDSWTRTLDDNGELTEKANYFVDSLEDILGNQFALIGTGRGTNDIIVGKNILK